MGNNDDIFMARYSAFNPYRIRHSDMGYQKPIGSGDALAKSLYGCMSPMAYWTGSDSSKCLPTGGVFNLEFSPEGSLLVAACEKKSIQIFDPLTHKLIHSVAGAHMDCVNCVKFLDGRMFATCSDDTTIALWDVRNLKKKIRSLFGHSKWVKNIEFSVKDQLLVTSGLDGSIYTWDINSYTESNLVYQRVFHTSSLMRCRLSPDASKMIMCTTGGLLLIIHDLNLGTLQKDLHGFKPNLYRLMQMSNQVIPLAASCDHLFDLDRKENRVEFVTDFPEGNDAEVVSALQIHPHGWNALSRNISHDDRSEWTCIHDIQPLDRNSSKDTRDPSPPLTAAPRPPRRTPGARRSRMRPRPYRQQVASFVMALHQHLPPLETGEEDRNSSRSSSEEREQPLSGPARRRMFYRDLLNLNTPRELRSGRRSESVSSTGAGPIAESSVNPGAEGSATPGPEGSATPGASASGSAVPRGSPVPGGSTGLRESAGTEASAAPGGSGGALVAGHSRRRVRQGIQNDVWEAAITLKQHRLLQEIYSRGQARPNFNMQRITGVNTGITPPSRPSPAPDQPVTPDRPSTSGHSPREASISEEAKAATRHYIRQNRQRLLYYTEETNEGKGFIKELCYSSDGRLVCSPFGNGMRLLALNENCSEASQCVVEHDLPRALVEVGQSIGVHQDLVVSSKFSPRHHVLVTGCLEGKIVWYQPYSNGSS